jgi:serine/threonine-protein kinase
MKFKAILLSALIFFGIFICGAIVMNIAMKFIVQNRDEVKVPSLVGLSYDEAKDLCSDNNLYIAISDYEYHELPKNSVVSQNPYSDKTVFENRTVYVVLSLGSKKVTVPNLTNFYVDDAPAILKKYDLKMGSLSYEYSDEYQQNYIIYSLPRAGASIMAGDSVRVVISKGHDPNSAFPDSLLQNSEPEEDDYGY